jgi:DNA-binding NarL/FixJ family response regulator
MKTITIVAIDDHPLIRQAIRSLVEERADMSLVGEGSAGEDVLALAEEHKPDVLLLDLSMPQHAEQEGQRFQALPTISKLVKRCPETAVIILTQQYVPVLIGGAISRGVKGYLLKSDDLSLNLPGAIETVSKGGVYFSETISQKLFGNGKPDAAYIEHAGNLNITESGFKSHLGKAFKALGVTNVTAAMIRCMELGILNTERSAIGHDQRNPHDPSEGVSVDETK